MPRDLSSHAIAIFLGWIVCEAEICASLDEGTIICPEADGRQKCGSEQVYINIAQPLSHQALAFDEGDDFFVLCDSGRRKGAEKG
jgi:hypothetical protein